MPHHVGVGVVDHHQGIDALLDGGDAAIGELFGRHGGGLVVGGNPRRWHQVAVFPGEGLLDAPIHEVGDMGIFLGFSGAELAQPRLGHHLTEQPIQGLGREGHGHGEALLVLGERDHIQIADQAAFKVVEGGQNQGTDQLSHPIRTEVEADQPIAGLDQIVR